MSSLLLRFPTTGGSNIAPSWAPASANNAFLSASLTGVSRAIRPAGPSSSTSTGRSHSSLPMEWLAAGVPLTLLMDLAAVYCRYSSEIARDEARARRFAAAIAETADWPSQTYGQAERPM